MRERDIPEFSHEFPFDPRYGYTERDLLVVGAPEPPADFALFWEDIYARAMAIPLNISRREIASGNAGVRVFEIEYDSWGGLRIGGWLTVPADGNVECALVVGHGYGGREAPDFGMPVERAAVIFPCARGMHRSAHPGIPADGQSHVVCGIGSRETYVHLGCVVDYWLAASAVLELYPEAASKLYYIGGSFGGGIGALMLPWDRRFSKAHLNIPSFGNHPLRVTLPCVGSGSAVRELYCAGHPEILDVLKYFDAATAARFIRIPVYSAVALFDPAVPPPGQFAIHNALSGEKKLFLREAAHFEFDGAAAEDAEIHSRLVAWFS